MTDESGARSGLGPRREFVALLLCGVVGTGLVLLATRQQAARVDVVAPHPLPVTVTVLSVQSLLPAGSALAVAALASLAAVVATRGWLRWMTGLITGALGLAVGFSAVARLSAGQVLTAAGHANLSPASGAAGGTAPGSTTAGGGAGQSGGSLAGFPAHVVLAGSAWRVLMLLGALLIVSVGAAVVVTARRLPVMAGRYERSALARGGTPSASPEPPAVLARGLSKRPAGPADRAPSASGARAGDGRGNAATMWESLTAGADPTTGPGDDGAD